MFSCSSRLNQCSDRGFPNHLLVIIVIATPISVVHLRHHIVTDLVEIGNGRHSELVVLDVWVSRYLGIRTLCTRNKLFLLGAPDFRQTSHRRTIVWLFVLGVVGDIDPHSALACYGLVELLVIVNARVKNLVLGVWVLIMYFILIISQFRLFEILEHWVVIEVASLGVVLVFVGSLYVFSAGRHLRSLLARIERPVQLILGVSGVLWKWLSWQVWFP